MHTQTAALPVEPAISASLSISTRQQPVCVQLPSGATVEAGATWFHGVCGNPLYEIAVWEGLVQDLRTDPGEAATDQCLSSTSSFWVLQEKGSTSARAYAPRGITWGEGLDCPVLQLLT